MPEPLQPLAPLSWRERLVELLELVTPFRVVAALVGSIALGALAFLVLRPPAPPAELVLPRADPAARSTGAPAGPAPPTGAPPEGQPATTVAGPSSAGATVTVHAAGQVRAPGVYSVPSGARVADVIGVAGGFTSEADVDTLNLAAKVADGSRIYVPRTGERAPPAGAESAIEGGPGDAGSVVAGAGGLVDLNTATAAQLDALPGVGPATAAAILAYRARHGGFKTVTELLEVPGIGPAKLETLRPHVTVG